MTSLQSWEAFQDGSKGEFWGWQKLNPGPQNLRVGARSKAYDLARATELIRSRSGVHVRRPQIILGFHHATCDSKIQILKPHKHTKYI